LVLTGFIVGIPLFYNVGFVLLVPLIFSIVYRLKLPAVYVGIPMLAALSVTHGLLPPHPSPAALVNQLHADMGKTLLYGICIAIPTIIVAGPLFATTLKKMDVEPLQTFKPKDIEVSSLPSFLNSIITCLLPVFILLVSTYFHLNTPSNNIPLIQFISDPSMLMFISMVYATIALGITRGKSLAAIMHTYADSIKDVLMIILIVSGAGALKQVYVDSGVSAQLADAFNQLQLPPLLLGWLISAIIRVAMGSATVAGLTTAGIIAPVVISHTYRSKLDGIGRRLWKPHVIACQRQRILVVQRIFQFEHQTNIEILDHHGNDRFIHGIDRSIGHRLPLEVNRFRKIAPGCKWNLYIRKVINAYINSSHMFPRRTFLKSTVAASGLPLLSSFTQENKIIQPVEKRIRFSVININHNHIYGMTSSVINGGGELVAVYAKEPELIAAYTKAFPQVKVASSEKEILEDNSIQLILSSGIPVERGPLGIEVMKHGKDYLVDKPGITTLEQLAEVKKVQKETKRILLHHVQ